MCLRRWALLARAIMIMNLGGYVWQAGSWVFDTSTEAQYPHLLAQRAIECVVLFLAKKGTMLEKESRPPTGARISPCDQA